jgi:septum formation protein
MTDLFIVPPDCLRTWTALATQDSIAPISSFINASCQVTLAVIKPKLDLILASASPRREQLLRELLEAEGSRAAMGLHFVVMRPDGVEEATGGAAPDVLVMQNAQRKARAVAGRHPEAMVIGADTEVVLDGAVFGKPRDLNDAETMLSKLAGRRHDVFTGVCVIHRALDTEITFAERSRVWMRPLTVEQIRDYFTKVNPLDKAGAYGAQEHGDLIIERIEGSSSNVMGLPTERLRATLARIGIVNRS